MSNKTPGLYQRNGVWHIDKQVKGFGRLCESCGTRNLGEAERLLAFRLEEIRQATIYGVRPTRTFEQAAIKYLEENHEKRSIERDAYALKQLIPYIGKLPLEQVHNDSLRRFKAERISAGRTPGTVNKELATVRKILNRAARVWRHENGTTWLETAPLLEMVKGPSRSPYPISWEEQAQLFDELPDHLADMAIFAVNTGCRSGEVCRLRWEYEVEVTEINDSVFVIPEHLAKNGRERVVILNKIARDIVEKQRSKSATHVFTFKGNAIQRMRTKAWGRARERAGLPNVRVHDLRHTFGHRLRAAGVDFEDRQDLLGHHAGRITTHYCAADLQRLVTAVNKICERRPSTVIRIASAGRPAEVPQVAEILAEELAGQM